MREEDQAPARVDVEVLWELLRDEGGRYEPAELAELALDDGGEEAQASVVAALRDDRTWFTERKGRFEPRPESSVREALRQRRLAEERVARHAAALRAARHALQTRQPLPRGEHEEVLRPLVDLAAHGDAAAKREAAEALLSDLGCGTRGAPWLTAFRLLVRLGWLDEDENLLLLRKRIPTRFAAAVLAEAEAAAAGADPVEEEARVDRTDVLTVAIDDAGTREVDDALSAWHLPDGGWRLEVHIADAAAWVPQGGAVDVEAGRRRATLYLPDRTLTMLPPVLACDRASLAQGAVRAALTFSIDIDEHGHFTDFTPRESTVRVDRQLTYEEADHLLETQTEEGRLLRTLRSLAETSRERRMEAGALTVQPPEAKVRLDEAGEVQVIPIDRSSPARQLVAEWMIITGHLAARWFESQGIPAVYRCQDSPDVDVSAAGSEGMADPVVFHSLVRRLRRATVGTRPGLHAGLGVNPYVQVTSPIRRRSDLLLHRQIKGWLREGEAPLSEGALLDAIGPVEETVAVLAKIERETTRYFLLKLLAAREGEHVSALVLEQRERGRWLVELDGLALQVPVALGRKRALGEMVTLRVAVADPREDRLVLKEVPVGQSAHTPESKG